MRKILFFSYIFFVFSTFILLGLSSPCLAAKENQVGDKDNNTIVTEDQKTTFISLYSWATILPKELIDLQSRITKEKKIKSIEEEIPHLTAEIEAIRWDTNIAKTSRGMQQLQLASLQTKTQKIDTRLKKITEPINSLISFWSDARKLWMSKKDQILLIDKNEQLPLVLEAEQHKMLLETVDEAIRLIEEHLKLVLTIGKKIGDLQILLYSVDSDLQALNVELKTTSIQQTAPSMLSKEFYSRINVNLISLSYQTTKRFLKGRLNSLKNNPRYLVLSFLSFILICFAIKKTEDFARPESQWRPFTRRPFSTTIFMASSINLLTNIFPVNADLPEHWEALLHVLTLFAVTRLTKNLMGDNQKRKLLKQLAFFTGMTMILFLLSLPQMLILLYVFYVSIVVFLYYLFKLPSTKGKNFKDIWPQRIWGIFPALVILLGVTGYDQLAIMIFSTLLSSIIACMIIWVLYRFHLGVIELILSVLPITLIQDNFSEILKSIHPIIKWLHILIFITVQSVTWDIYPTINTAFVGINNFGFDIGELHISLKFIFTVGIVFYGALITSKAIQALLLKNVLPRYKAEKGVQLSITRLAHYAILTCGFLIMLRVLGFQLNQLALLGGALGVGIGFGLQAIVNNFASGLILLFERPIKVGDTIQIGPEWGEVKQLGLRATIVQTFDNAEIVVPNSDLITGQVTNWTLGDRRVRIKIPIGVAYGSDVSKVLEILKSCGNVNPMVLSNPEPTALFLAFGTSSLDFELRVWIPEFLEKLQVLSDLNQDIDNEFAMNNIEIPFPQSDLHLRSVDEAAAEKIRGNVQLEREKDDNGK